MCQSVINQPTVGQQELVRASQELLATPLAPHSSRAPATAPLQVLFFVRPPPAPPYTGPLELRQIAKI